MATPALEEAAKFLEKREDNLIAGQWLRIQRDDVEESLRGGLDLELQTTNWTLARVKGPKSLMDSRTGGEIIVLNVYKSKPLEAIPMSEEEQKTLEQLVPYRRIPIHKDKNRKQDIPKDSAIDFVWKK